MSPRSAAARPAERDGRDLVVERLAAQHLTGPPLPTAADVVGRFGAAQAQEFAETLWSLAQRMPPGTTEAQLRAAVDAGEILRLHALRPTWHFVARRDIRWVLAATADRVHRASSSLVRQLELADVQQRAAEVMVEAVADAGPLTRAELAGALAAAGIPAASTKLAYLVMYAELQALLCSGPMRGKQHTYALVQDRAPDALRMSGEAAVVELARRYFASHAPAGIRDFCAWSSLTTRQARTAIAELGDDLVADDDGLLRPARPSQSASGDGRPPVATSRPDSSCLLLGTYDELIMGYRDRRYAVDGGAAAPTMPEHPVVVVDGLTVGWWRRDFGRSGHTIRVMPRRRLRPAELDAVAAATQRFGAFLSAPAELQIVQPAG